MTNDEILYQIYYTEKNFDSAKELYRKAKLRNATVTLNYVKDWLAKQATSQKFQPKTGKHEYLSIYAEDPYSYQMDLTFLPKYKSANDQNYVLFTAVNINSRYAYAYYGKDKSTETVLDMLKKFMNNAMIINSITCDSGSEFINAEVREWFEEEDIKVYFVVGDSHKLGIVNRFHRTLKGKLEKYFTSTDTYRWIDVIDKLIKNYNNTVNTGIGYTPLEASKGLIQASIINKAKEHNDKLEKKTHIDMYVNDSCRIKLTKKLFDKMQSDYSNEVYTITQVNKNSVNVTNDNHDIKNVKKSDIIIVNTVENNVSNTNKKTIEHKAKVERKMKQEDLGEIITTKRVKKENSKYKV